MTTLGFPGAFRGTNTTGYITIGAVGKQRTSAGFPGAFRGTNTTGYINIGAVQTAVAVTPVTAVEEEAQHAAGWMTRRAARRRPSVEREEQQPEPTKAKPEPVVEKVTVEDPGPSPAELQAQAEAEALLLRSIDRPGLEVGPLPKAPIGGPDLEAVNAILQGAIQPSPEELAARERKRVMQLAIVAYVAMWRN